MMQRVIDPNGYPCTVPGCDVVSPTPGAAGGHATAHARNAVISQRSYEPVTLELFCECGGALTLRGETSKPLARDIEQLWMLDHRSGDPGHGPVTAGEARDVRYWRKRHSTQEKEARHA